MVKAMPGRKPKPTQHKLLAGSPGHRTLNTNEPQFTRCIPQCPKHLDAIAKAEWDRVAQELDSTGVLTSVDMAALAAYCMAFSRWVKAEKLIKKDGLIFTSVQTGYQMQHPAIGIANKAMELMLKFCSEFGMTPSARTRIHVSTDPGKNNPDDAFAQFMGGVGYSTNHSHGLPN